MSNFELFNIQGGALGRAGAVFNRAYIRILRLLNDYIKMWQK